MNNTSDATLYPLAFAANATRQAGNRTWITCGGVNTQTRNCEALLGHGRGTFNVAVSVRRRCCS